MTTVPRRSSYEHSRKGTTMANCIAMKSRIGWLGGVGLLGAAMLASACASTPASAPLPPAKVLQPADLASLAGEWHGTLRGSGGANPATGRSAIGTMTMAPDGSYTT